MILTVIVLLMPILSLMAFDEYYWGFLLPCGITAYHTFLHEPTVDEQLYWENYYEQQYCPNGSIEPAIP